MTIFFQIQIHIAESMNIMCVYIITEKLQTKRKLTYKPSFPTSVADYSILTHARTKRNKDLLKIFGSTSQRGLVRFTSEWKVCCGKGPGAKYISVIFSCIFHFPSYSVCRLRLLLTHTYWISFRLLFYQLHFFIFFLKCILTPPIWKVSITPSG